MSLLIKTRQKTALPLGSWRDKPNLVSGDLDASSVSVSRQPCDPEEAVRTQAQGAPRPPGGQLPEGRSPGAAQRCSPPPRATGPGGHDGHSNRAILSHDRSAEGTRNPRLLHLLGHRSVTAPSCTLFFISFSQRVREWGCAGEEDIKGTQGRGGRWGPERSLPLRRRKSQLLPVPLPRKGRKAKPVFTNRDTSSQRQLN